MQMRTCGFPGTAHISEHVAALHFLTGFYSDLAHVSVQGFVSVTVADNHTNSITTFVVISSFYHTVSGCINFSSDRRSEIHSGVHLFSFVNWIDTISIT